MIKIDNHVITTSIKDILFDIQRKTNNEYLNRIVDRGDYISITCPWHKNGKESKPSCSIYVRSDNSDVNEGVCHCFTCGVKGNLVSLVSQCLSIDKEQSKQWLVDNYSDTDVEYVEYIPDMVADSESKVISLDSSILDKYNYYHPYMDYRKITPEVRKLFKVGYDQESDMITFPVWDDKGNLLFISKRSVKGKRFELAAGKDKPIYGLNFIKQKNITSVYVVESQINCLTLWGWGYPAIALFGTGSKKQYDILKKSGIRNYYLCFDGDLAGEHGRIRFMENITSDASIYYKEIPKNKDVNDLTKEEFDKIILKE